MFIKFIEHLENRLSPQENIGAYLFFFQKVNYQLI